MLGPYSQLLQDRLLTRKEADCAPLILELITVLPQVRLARHLGICASTLSLIRNRKKPGTEKLKKDLLAMRSRLQKAGLLGETSSSAESRPCVVNEKSVVA